MSEHGDLSRATAIHKLMTELNQHLVAAAQTGLRVGV